MTFAIHDAGLDYEGNYNPSEVVCEIRWCIEDLLVAMANQDIPLTDENVAAILDKYFASTLNYRLVEEGWEIINTLVSMEL